MPVQERLFLYDGIDVIAEYNGSSVSKRYVHGPGLDEPLVEYAGTGTSSRTFLIADERGSIVAGTNSSGAKTYINTYDEYGVPGSGNQGLFQYTGQVYLDSVDLYHYKARTYDPKTGRFLQADPIGYAAGMNLYGYVSADPMNLVDPLGLDEHENRDNLADSVWERTYRYWLSSRLYGYDLGQMDIDRLDARENARDAEILAYNNQAAASGATDVQTAPSSLDFLPGGPERAAYLLRELEVAPVTGAYTREEVMEQRLAYGVGTAVGAGTVACVAGGCKAIALGVVAFGKNISIDGPSAGLWHAQGRIIGLRWKESKWGVRLDLHGMRGDPTNTPVLHINYGPLNKGESNYIILYDPRKKR